MIGERLEVRILKPVLVSELLFDKWELCPDKQIVVTDELIRRSFLGVTIKLLIGLQLCIAKQSFLLAKSAVVLSKVTGKEGLFSRQRQHCSPGWINWSSRWSNLGKPLKWKDRTLNKILDSRWYLECCRQLGYLNPHSAFMVHTRVMLLGTHFNYISWI